MATSPESFGIERERERTIEEATQEGVDLAVRLVRDRFERDRNPENNLDFHNTKHTMDVIRRTEMMLRAVHAASPESVSDRDIQLGKLFAACHDVVQKWSVSEARHGNAIKRTRKRYIGQNERESANTAVHFMEEWNRGNGGELFSRDDMTEAYEAIDATVPDWEPNHHTVIQPNLKEQSSFVTRAVAMADLGTAGVDGAAKFLKEGDAVFREDNLDMKEAIEGGGKLADAEKESLRERMLAWTRSQPLFAEGRRDLFEREILPFPKAARDNLRKLFGAFDESIEAARERVLKRQHMTFEELAADMGYKRELKH